MLNLTTFIEKYSEINDMPKTKARAEIERFIATFKTCTYDFEGINLMGFAKSEVVNVPAKKGRNPKDGSIIDVPAKKVVKIKVSSKFKNLTEE